MLGLILVAFINIFVPIFSAVLLLRIILSYFVRPGNRFMELLLGLTEPVLAPLRRVLPSASGLDFAPLVALLLLQGLQTLVNNIFPL